MMHHPTMRAYSVDLGEKIVHAVLSRGMSKEEAARPFGIGASSVKRYVKKAESRESLATVDHSDYNDTRCYTVQVGLIRRCSMRF